MIDRDDVVGRPPPVVVTVAGENAAAEPLGLPGVSVQPAFATDGITVVGELADVDPRAAQRVGDLLELGVEPGDARRDVVRAGGRARDGGEVRGGDAGAGPDGEDRRPGRP